MAAQQVRIALDSSYVIALLCDWHAHHKRTLQSYQHWHDRDAKIVLPMHSILESYSVLTRIPAPHRLPPAIARQAIEETFGQTAVIAGMKPGRLWQRMGELARLGFGGGQVYDASIAWCAADAGATILLTWNLKHFAPLAPPDIKIREP